MPPRTRIPLFDTTALSRPSPTSTCSQCLRQVPKPRLTRSFSAAPTPQASRMRQEFYRWLQGPGAAFKEPLKDSTNYLNAYDAAGNLIRARARADRDQVDEEDRGRSIPRESQDDLQPFPLNQHFKSQSVLSEEHKDAIWTMVKQQGKSVREVSNLLGIDMNRVGAVVRLKGVEMDWKQKGKPLANAYNRAMLGMLPVTPVRGNPLKPQFDLNTKAVHESINDLNVHRATKEQIFFPASESRQFTRVDAGNVFEKGLLPADQRIPHPETIEYYRGQDTEAARQESSNNLQAFYRSEAQERDLAKTKRLQKKANNTITVEGDRAIFQVTNVTVDEHTVGMNGRGVRGVGVRYGFPHEDRKKGTIKIPTSVR